MYCFGFNYDHINHSDFFRRPKAPTLSTRIQDQQQRRVKLRQNPVKGKWRRSVKRTRGWCGLQRKNTKIKVDLSEYIRLLNHGSYTGLYRY